MLQRFMCITDTVKHENNIIFQANLAVQEARLAVAMQDLNEAQAQLDEKNRELAEVMAMYDAAMKEKQVFICLRG